MLLPSEATLCEFGLGESVSPDEKRIADSRHQYSSQGIGVEDGEPLREFVKGGSANSPFARELGTRSKASRLEGASARCPTASSSAIPRSLT